MSCSKMIVAGIVLAAIGGVSQAEVVKGDLLFSDDFNRADSAVDLGTTSTGGYAWYRGGSREWQPGIRDNALHFESKFDSGYVHGADAVSPLISGHVLNFILEVDYRRADGYTGPHGGNVSFRVPWEGAVLSSGGVHQGYNLVLTQNSSDTLGMVLQSDNVGDVMSGEVVTGGGWNHIRLVAWENTFAAYAMNSDGEYELALSYTDDTGLNPAATVAGEFTFVGNRLRAHEFDNLAVWDAVAIPEPTAVVLFGVAVLGVSLQRRRCSA